MDDSGNTEGAIAGPTGGTWPLEAALVVAGIAAWGWIVTPLAREPSELWLPAAAVPVIAVATFAAERWRRGGGVAALGAAAAIGVVGLAAVTGTSPVTLVSFALGLLKPAGWQGDHLFLRAVPLLLLVAFPLRKSWGAAVLSALGATAFLAIAAAMARAAA